MSQPHEFIPVPLVEQSSTLAISIRDHARAQLPMWQLIPNLAMEIALRERQGLLSRINDAFMSHRWNVYSRSTGMPSPVIGLPTMEMLDVDLNTGEIMSFQRDASDQEVLKLAPNLQDLDAVQVIESMVERIKAFDSQGRKRFATEETERYYKKMYEYSPVDLEQLMKTVSEYKEQSSRP